MRPLSLALVCATPFIALAQNEEDALRSSYIAPGGTARSIGMANAFGALGADGVSVMINPAGMGLYRRSELSFTPSLEVNGVTSRYYGTSSTDSRTRFYFGNLALALNVPAERGSDWRSSTFGVIYDRQATQHWARQAIGKGIATSILDDFASRAEGTTTDGLFNDPSLQFSSALAYDTYGIDPLDPNDSLSTSYVAALPFGAKVNQTNTIDSRGAISNTSFFYSGNYMDRLYIGLSVGVIGYRYRHVLTHTETVPDESIDLKDLSYRDEVSTTGNGVDVKAGVIYRPHDRFRMGAAFHSPMWLQLNDAYVSSMKTEFRTPSSTDGRTSYSSTSPDGVYNYRVSSPWRTVLSAAYIAGEHGLVSVDYEYTDYSKMRLRRSNRLLDAYDYVAENEAVSNSFRAVHTVRVGTEWRAGNWYFRMGWGFTPDPYEKDDLRHGQALRTYAGGVGYRTDHVGVDLGVNYAQRTTSFFQYDPTLVNTTLEERTNMRTLVTVSMRP